MHILQSRLLPLHAQRIHDVGLSRKHPRRGKDRPGDVSVALGACRRARVIEVGADPAVVRALPREPRREARLSALWRRTQGESLIMAFETPNSNGNQSNSDPNTNSDDRPASTVSIDGEELPVTDAVARLVDRVDALQDETEMPMADVPYTDEDEPVPVAVSDNAERVVEAASDIDDVTGRVDTLRLQVRELQKTVNDVGALLTNMDDRLDENPIRWDHPVKGGND